ncbi:MAG TPA: hypothetical protein VFT85_02855, partial [Acidimicrobiia bacterium]|nr:hypothetical protein [Acidimicrobiia bacterium]
DAPTSDQFIGMTRMRAVELGIPVVHAAVTGKSTIIDYQGSFDSTTDTGESVVFFGDIGLSTSTIYSTIGDSFLFVAALLGLFTVFRYWSLVGSGRMRSNPDVSNEED